MTSTTAITCMSSSYYMSGAFQDARGGVRIGTKFALPKKRSNQGVITQVSQKYPKADCLQQQAKHIFTNLSMQQGTNYSLGKSLGTFPGCFP